MMKTQRQRTSSPDDDSPGIKVLYFEIAREEPLSKIGWWIFLRWMLLGVVLLATITSSNLFQLNIPTRTVLFLCLPIILFNAGLHYYFIALKKAALLEAQVVTRITHLQLGVDWIFIAALFHFTGGIASPLLFYILFHVILSGVLLEQRACLLYITLIAFTIMVLASLELIGSLPHRYEASFVRRSVQDNVFFVLLVILFSLTVLYVSGYLVSTLLARLRDRVYRLMRLEQKLEKTNQQLEILNKMARETTSTFGLSPRLSFICESVRYLMGVKGAAIRLLDEKTNRLELVSACGLSDAYINKGPVDADKSLARALQGEPHLVLDVAGDPSVQYPEEAAKEGIVSMLSFPLKGREKVIGTLRLYTSEKRNFNQDERDFLSTLANQGAISIENAKIYDLLQRQDEAKSNFIFMMTHQLKGPLMAIQGFLEVMLKGYAGPLKEKQKELIERMHQRIESVLGLSTELLTMYQWQARGPSVHLVEVSLTLQIQKAVDLFKTLVSKKGLSLLVEMPEEEITVMATNEDIEEILNNLITNAIKYTPPPGNIKVTLSRSDKQIHLRVIDGGIGIPAEELLKIFDEFYRTKRAKAIDPDGSGLGLPFVKRIVESLGGSIRAVSEENMGTEFIVTLSRHL